jgi:hypothetical protein
VQTWKGDAGFVDVEERWTLKMDADTKTDVDKKTDVGVGANVLLRS